MLKLELATDPERGVVVPDTGGFRKVRMKLEGKGRRGGGRVIYYYLCDVQLVALVYAYPKNRKDNLTEQQKQALRSVATHLKQEKDLPI